MKTAVKFCAATAISLLLYACSNKKTTVSSAEGTDIKAIGALLDTFNAAAARADYTAYFNCLGDDAIFIGTDATERWRKDSFAVWAKPFFERGRAWNFKSIERHIYALKDSSTAWFDELLNTQMKVCRGSGVVIKTDKGWKIQQYVLSTTIPNGILDSVVSMKAPVDDLIIKEKTENR